MTQELATLASLMATRMREIDELPDPDSEKYALLWDAIVDETRVYLPKFSPLTFGVEEAPANG